MSSNVDEMLGLKEKGKTGAGESGDEFVVFEGSPLEITGQVKAIADGRGMITVLE